MKKHMKEEQNSFKMPQNCRGYFWRVQEPWLASHCCLPLMRNSYKVKKGKEGRFTIRNFKKRKTYFWKREAGKL